MPEARHSAIRLALSHALVLPNLHEEGSADQSGAKLVGRRDSTMKWIMCDLDGTILPFVLKDSDSLEEKRQKLVNAIAYPCQDCLRMMEEEGYDIVIVTGRAVSEFKDITEAWLEKYCVFHTALVMLFSPWESKHDYYVYKLNIAKCFQPHLIIDDDLHFLLLACQRGYKVAYIENRESWLKFENRKGEIE